jgi:hypothetical protein
MTKRKKRGGGPTAAIGGMLAGFDHQIFRTTPPPHELVLKASPVRGLSGEPGGLEVTFPDDEDAAAAGVDGGDVALGGDEVVAEPD